MPTEPGLHAGSRLRHARRRIGALALALMLCGCASRVDVRPMATGRVDVAAYELNGGDVHALRSQAQRLCPLGGDIVREAGHSLPPEADAGRWRSAVNTLAAWAEPPGRPAQLVVVCRKAGDHDKLQAVAPRPAAVQRAPAPRVDVTAALPIGPINPEW